ncbi:MAG TPA: AMP-binding protein [Thermoanaerobaculia bacterium]|nr:AMP-binding protein [Thermoanaerobaculia bacterium]
MTVPRPIRDLLRERARTDGDRPAVFSGGGALSYGEVASRAAEAAEELRRAGVGPGVQVALALPNSPDYLVWFFAILEAGGIVVPLLSSTAPAEKDALFEDRGIGSVVSPPGPFLRRTRFVPRPVASDPDAAEDVVACQYSSGSTGFPRAILRTAGNFLADGAHYATTLGVGPDDRFLGVAPFSHAFGGKAFLTAFSAGASVIPVPRFLPGPVFGFARRHGPTVILATPPMISVLATCALAPGEEGSFRSVRHCICSGGPLGKAARDAFVSRFGVPVRVQYGSTETLAATIDLDDGFEEGRVGRPFEGVAVRVFDEGGNVLPPGTPGRVGIRSAAVCRGYANDPAATAERFRGGFAFPGDRGVVDARGVLHLLGRSDIVNVGGAKVDPVEVTDVIRAALPVSAVEVYAGEVSGLPAVFVAVEADPSVVTPALVVARCRARLSPYKVPARVHVVPCLPRNEAGKVIRAALDAIDRVDRA